MILPLVVIHLHHYPLLYFILRFFRNKMEQAFSNGEALNATALSTCWEHKERKVGGDIDILCEDALGVGAKVLGIGATRIVLGATTTTTTTWDEQSAVFIPHCCLHFQVVFCSFLSHMFTIVYHMNITRMQTYWTSMLPNCSFLLYIKCKETFKKPRTLLQCWGGGEGSSLET